MAEGTAQKKDNVLFMRNVRLDVRKNFFTIRVVQEWNRLPDDVRQQKTVHAFKNKYDEWKRRDKNPS